MQSHQRLIIPVAAAFVFIVAGLLLVRGFGGTMAAAPSSNVAHASTVEQVSNEILETAKGLWITQQQDRSEGGDQKACRADHYVDRET
jgi:hypothetical protein